MRLRTGGAAVMTAATVAGFCGAAWAGPVNVDFSFDHNNNALGNGQIIDNEFFSDFILHSPDTNISHAGLGIFDSTPGGPNAGGGDPDLLVGLGNVLIMQNNNGSFGNNNGSFFNTPDDEADFNPIGEGRIVFSFNTPVSLQSIDLIDVNGGVLMDVVMTDGNGLTRTYLVPSQWTFDEFNNPAGNGYDTLDLTTLANQVGEAGGAATASEQAGFDANDVAFLMVRLHGSSPSGAIDNLVYSVVPSPGAIAVLGLAMLGARRRRRG